MNKINGYTVIAHKPYGNNEGFVILGVKPHRYNTSGFEYVSAVVDTLDAEDWSWGYYNGDLDLAHDRYTQRG